MITEKLRQMSQLLVKLRAVDVVTLFHFAFNFCIFLKRKRRSGTSLPDKFHCLVTFTSAMVDSRCIVNAW